MDSTNGKTSMHQGRDMYHEVESVEELHALLLRGGIVRRCAFQGIDFTSCPDADCRYEDCLFMGCVFNKRMREQIDGSCLVFSKIGMPYNAFRNELYTADSLYNGYVKGNPDSYVDCYDNIVYQHYLNAGKTATDIKETLARTLHDRAISDALHEFLSNYEEKQIVGIMGGHGLLRTDKAFRQVANISKRLTESGYIMVSGGGPGAMEATHFGAWMSGRSNDDLLDAATILAEAPVYSDENWLATSFRVMDKFPDPLYNSLGIPTWHYGHELPTPFATHISKYFENSVREEGLLALAKGGVIFTPGSAGTMQEVFQDLAQNHYESYGYASPMIFLNVDFWTKARPIYPIIQQMSDNGDLMNLNLGLYDNNEDVLEHLKRFV